MLALPVGLQSKCKFNDLGYDLNLQMLQPSGLRQDTDSDVQESTAVASPFKHSSASPSKDKGLICGLAKEFYAVKPNIGNVKNTKRARIPPPSEDVQEDAQDGRMARRRL